MTYINTLLGGPTKRPFLRPTSVPAIRTRPLPPPPLTEAVHAGLVPPILRTESVRKAVPGLRSRSVRNGGGMSDSLIEYRPVLVETFCNRRSRTMEVAGGGWNIV